ncbi:MAG: hypothetical protein GXP10_01740 [Gammaproteobacteria bacterium]|nr:hypothetical protein [Gammaproteobacteria bacterium]
MSRHTICDTLRIILCFGLLCSSPLLLANHPPMDADAPSLSYLTQLQAPRDTISNQLNNFANWLDSFFENERFDEESRGNHLRLRTSSVWSQKSKPQYDANLRLKLELPNTKKRLRFVIESNSEEETEDDTSRGERTLTEAVASQEQSVTLQYIPKATSKRNVNFSSGVKLRSAPDLFSRLRLRQTTFLEEWTLRATQTFLWFESGGFSSKTRVDFEHLFNKHYFLRISSQAIWRETTQLFDLSQSVSLFHYLNKHNVISYGVSLYGTNEPAVHATDYVVSLNWRRQIHQNWVFLDIRPQLRFPKEEKFHATASLAVQLEIIFSDT